MGHLSIKEQQQMLSHQKVSWKQKLRCSLHLFLCRQCRQELHLNRENMDIISQLQQHYLRPEKQTGIQEQQ